MRGALRIAVLCGACAVGGALAGESASPPPASPPALLFSESFDDARLLERKWYDGDTFVLSDREPWAGAASIEYAWKEGATKPCSSSGVRRLFEPTAVVHLRFHIRLSEDWGWTGKPYHPHLVQFMTTENDAWRGPASSRLTVYVEPWNGRLRLAAQDIENEKAPHGLTQGPLKGGYNGRTFDSADVLFTDERWHCVEAMFQLNTLDAEADRPNADGVVRAWFDGKLVVDRADVVLRSTDWPKMRFNQFLLLPYFGPGLLPHAQSLWIDELAVGTKRLEPARPSAKPR